MEQHIFGVTEVNHLVKLLLDNEPMLANVAVRGELSNYKIYPSGHHYFTLKDPEGSLRCVMFKGSAMKLRFRPENGMKVVVTGRITVFPRDGAYQLYCNTLTPEGAGDLAVAFEQLKAKLHAEGLFDPEHKKSLPAYPERIAVITSAAGAAVHDMIRILRRRYPLAKVILLPVRVQGAEAPPEIVGAIRYANRWKVADLIITGRGGGSMEDLWAFNDERVARAIYESELPVISAVGHESDFTICDFVADRRAPTPSAAAELAVPDMGELLQSLWMQGMRLQSLLGGRLSQERRMLEALANAAVLRRPEQLLDRFRMQLADREERMERGAALLLERRRTALARAAGRLQALSPLSVLARGYAAVEQEGRTCSSASALLPGDRFTVRFSDGLVRAVAEGVELFEREEKEKD